MNIFKATAISLTATGRTTNVRTITTSLYTGPRLLTQIRAKLLTKGKTMTLSEAIEFHANGADPSKLSRTYGELMETILAPLRRQAEAEQWERGCRV